MRALWLVLMLLPSLPARGAEKTVLLRLHHLQAADVEARLPAGPDGLVPQGITAWTVDERRNALSVTGSEAGIQEFQRVLRLVDVPVGRVRLSVRFVRIDPSELPAFGLPMEGGVLPVQYTAGFTALTDRRQVAALEGRPAVFQSELQVAHNRPLHVRWPADQAARGVQATVVPLVNADASVTLLFSTREPGTVASTPAPSGIVALRRLPVGAAGVILPRTPGPALVVTVREVMPARAVRR
jgi:hypothetical protein